MSLFVVSTPIGDSGDITLRAIEILKSADLVIGEERKEVSKLLKTLEIQKPIEMLNEHSKQGDFDFLAQQCLEKNVALVSDCGTPGFCDPGAELVRRCRARGIEVKPVPGASSLLALIAVSGWRLDQFVFFGFLPAKQELRAGALKKLRNEMRASVLMDTPYRLAKLLNELKEIMPNRLAVLGLDLTLPSEQVVEAQVRELAHRYGELKAEFVLLLAAETGSRPSADDTRRNRVK